MRKLLIERRTDKRRSLSGDACAKFLAKGSSLLENERRIPAYRQGAYSRHKQDHLDLRMMSDSCCTQPKRVPENWATSREPSPSDASSTCHLGKCIPA